MKMRKLLATGVAATLAVTSLATAASAAELAFPMGKTEGTVKQTDILGWQLVDIDYLTEDNLGGLTGFIYVNSKWGNYNLDGAKLVITGRQAENGESKDYTYNFVDTLVEGQGEYDGKYVIELVDGAANKAGQVNINAYNKIDSIKIYVNRSKTYGNASDYDKDWGIDGNGQDIATIDVIGTSGVLIDLEDDIETSKVDKGNWSNVEKSTKVNYPFLPVTDGFDGEKVDTVLKRKEIIPLSYAGAWSAMTVETIGDQWIKGLIANYDDNQSYGDNGLGDAPVIFGGFASQVADFFNKQTNGTITFKFTTPTASSSTAWENGGVPSTQVGIKNFLGDATANDFALFFNYDQTGSLQAVTSIDANAGTVTFTIDDVLDALGGQTIGVINNVFYGLVKGATNLQNPWGGDWTYKVDGKDVALPGLYIESVTLAYAEDEAADDDIVEDDADDAEDDADDVVEDDADDADDDVDLDDDADDVIEDDADDAEDDADVDGEVVTTPDTDDDANPPTGVALAVVPAMIAAAAVVVSKKRK